MNGEMTMPEPDYVVIRAAADLPPGAVPEGFEGRWLDRTQVEPAPLVEPANVGKATAVPTGRFEVREYDGAVAEVWEIRP